MAIIAQRIRNNFTGLERQARPAVVIATSTVNSAAVSVNVNFSSRVSVDDVLENLATGEQVLITSSAGTDPGAIGLSRGYNGTTAAAITTGDRLAINPRLTDQMIQDAITGTIQEIEDQGVIVMAESSLTLVSGQDVYPLNVEIDSSKGVLDIYYEEQSDQDLVPIPFHNLSDFSELSTEAWAVRLLDWGNNSAGDQLTVVYAVKISTVATASLPVNVQDVLVMGATARLYDSLEGPRLHDPGRYTDRTVQPGQFLRDANVWWGRFQRQLWRVRATTNVRISRLPGNRWRRVRRYLGSLGNGGGLYRGNV